MFSFFPHHIVFHLLKNTILTKNKHLSKSIIHDHECKLKTVKRKGLRLSAGDQIMKRFALPPSSVLLQKSINQMNHQLDILRIQYILCTMQNTSYHTIPYNTINPEYIKGIVHMFEQGSSSIIVQLYQSSNNQIKHVVQTELSFPL